MFPPTASAAARNVSVTLTLARRIAIITATPRPTATAATRLRVFSRIRARRTNRLNSRRKDIGPRFLFDLSVLQLQDSTGKRGSVIGVGGDHHRDAAGVVQFRQQFEDSQPVDAVEAPGRLVGDHQLRRNVNTDPPYNVKVEPRSNNAIAAGNSSFANSNKHHQKFDLERHPEKSKPTHKKMRAKAGIAVVGTLGRVHPICLGRKSCPTKGMPALWTANNHLGARHRNRRLTQLAHWGRITQFNITPHFSGVEEGIRRSRA